MCKIYSLTSRRHFFQSLLGEVLVSNKGIGGQALPLTELLESELCDIKPKYNRRFPWTIIDNQVVLKQDETSKIVTSLSELDMFVLPRFGQDLSLLTISEEVANHFSIAPEKAWQKTKQLFFELTNARNMQMTRDRSW
jgi:hypothetical protein